ncbi:efflux RND transporter periplasmic adaptor subunit [Reinekea marina]|uniref:Efflux RND transporter periplasmic adaptor subunit n=1 Tax=Reinekea marina TaxID=1310421 RepID=A0ABV7WM35_9GAMM|nr:efflux RND transporter periplasmic adaptor subunit [Reinekea marina]MDN3649886.1 efflux RND transporter periplasmic adaptor subunit [Reinekea marina]
MKKLLLVVIIVLAVVGLSYLGNNKKTDEPDTVQTFSVIEQPIESTVLASGRLTYGDEFQIRSEVNARVEEITVEEGDLVKKGQVLIRLDQESFETEVDNQQTNVALRAIDKERAQLRIESLQIQLNRQLKLASQGAAQATTIEDMENQIAQAKVDLKMQSLLQSQAQEALDQAKKRLEKTIIRAPVSGLVSALDIKKGELAVSGGADISLMTLVDPSVIFTEIDVDEADIGHVSLGLPVRVFAVAFLDEELTGEVTKIATSARNVPGKNSLVFPVEVKVQGNENVTLRPGMSTRAEIVNRSERSWPLVPIEAIQEQTEGGEVSFKVFIAKDGKVTSKNVELGTQDDRYQAIKSGLSASDEVVIGPYRVLRTLKDGQAITVKNDD